jgi:hypothetical protein
VRLVSTFVAFRTVLSLWATTNTVRPTIACNNIAHDL